MSVQGLDLGQLCCLESSHVLGVGREEAEGRNKGQSPTPGVRQHRRKVRETGLGCPVQCPVGPGNEIPDDSLHSRDRKAGPPCCLSVPRLPQGLQPPALGLTPGHVTQWDCLGPRVCIFLRFLGRYSSCSWFGVHSHRTTTGAKLNFMRKRTPEIFSQNSGDIWQTTVVLTSHLYFCLLFGFFSKRDVTYLQC